MTTETAEYVMPKVSLGDQVYYYRHDGAKPEIAWVTDTSARTLTLWVLTPNGGGSDRFSVHHLSDPGVLEFPAWKEYGFWDYRAKAMDAILSEKVALLERRLEALEGKKAK